MDGEPGVHLIAADPKQKEFYESQRRPGITYDGYHSDTNWRIVPSWGAVLRAVNLPPVGGDTIWVDAGKAYRELPDDLKKRLEGLHAIVDFRRGAPARGPRLPAGGASHRAHPPRDRRKDPVGRFRQAPADRWRARSREPRIIATDPGPLPQVGKSGSLPLEAGLNRLLGQPRSSAPCSSGLRRFPAAPSSAC